MATDVRQFTVKVTAGTPVSAYATFNLTMPPRIVREVHIRVPPGPRAEVGFALGAAGQPIIPYAPNTWIITDDEKIEWPLDFPIDTGAWQLFAYNTGTFDHTLYITFLCDVPGEVSTVSSLPTIANAALSSSGAVIDLGSSPTPPTDTGGNTPPVVVTPPVTQPPIVVAPPVLSPVTPPGPTPPTNPPPIVPKPPVTPPFNPPKPIPPPTPPNEHKWVPIFSQ